MLQCESKSPNFIVRPIGQISNCSVFDLATLTKGFSKENTLINFFATSCGYSLNVHTGYDNTLNIYSQALLNIFLEILYWLQKKDKKQNTKTIETSSLRRYLNKLYFGLCGRSVPRKTIGCQV